LNERRVVIGMRRIEEMQAEAKYHRERYDLYKAKAYGPRLTSPARLQELERRYRSAEARLRAALRENEEEESGAAPSGAE
jgi:hypothetical protein